MIKLAFGSGRVDNAYGDRNIVCSCVPMEAFAEDGAETAAVGAGSR